MIDFLNNLLDKFTKNPAPFLGGIVIAGFIAMMLIAVIKS